MPRLPRLLSAVSLALFLAACSPGEEAVERAIEQNAGGNVDVEMDGDSMQVTNDQGTMVMGSGELQAGWPEDVPTYPGADVTYSALVSAEGGPGAAATLQTKDSVDTVFADLKSRLEGAGWTIDGHMDVSGMKTIAASKGTRVYSAAIQGGPNGTTITIGMGEQ